MSSARTVAARVIDAALEGTIVASFTKLGYKARAAAFDWQPLPDMTGQTVLITGGTSGIGRATAAGIMNLGATVIVTSRDQQRADAAATELNASGTSGTALGMAVDTGDHDSVRKLVVQVTSETASLDVLINNAGALTDGYSADADGTELTLSSHLIGPFILTCGLKDHMVPGGRVLWMSSGGMYTQGLELNSIETTPDNYKGAVAYAKAKRGQVELVALLGPHWAPDLITHTMHPGWVNTPGVDAGLPGFGKIMGPTLRTAEQGADTMVWLAATGGNDAPAGSFFLDRRPRRTSYIPGTGTNDAERRRLLYWLQELTGEQAF